MMHLDRFSQGLADSQDADFWECGECGTEVYDMETEECPACKWIEAEQKFIAFRKDLRMLELRHGIRIIGDGGDYFLRHEESGEEEEL